MPPRNKVWYQLWTFDLDIAILRREKIFSPEGCRKVVKFANNDRLNVLILLARDEQILLFPLKMIQRGDHWMIFHIIFQEKIFDFASL